MFLEKNKKDIIPDDLFAFEKAKDIIDQEVKNNGIKVLSQITDEVTQEIKSTSKQIPLLRDILKYIFKCSSTDNKVKNELLNQIDKYVSSRDNLILRNIAIELLSECRPDDMLPGLTLIAKDRREDNNIRLHVLGSSIILTDTVKSRRDGT